MVSECLHEWTTETERDSHQFCARCGIPRPDEPAPTVAPAKTEADRKSAFPANERDTFPSLYYAIVPDAKEVARGLGYALLLHGSMSRDLDLVAIPWTGEAASAEELVEAIRFKFQCWIGGVEIKGGMREKPHGRRAWSLHLGGHAFIDLSVMPRIAEGRTRVLQDGVRMGRVRPKAPSKVSPRVRRVDCGVCLGSGVKFEPGCFGGRYVRCEACHGVGTALVVADPGTNEEGKPAAWGVFNTATNAMVDWATYEDAATAIAMMMQGGREGTCKFDARPLYLGPQREGS
jgi:hypothetical protein